MKHIPLYKFYKHKYGTELLIDVLDLEYIKDGIRHNPIHRETFYCIILISAGCEELTVNRHKRLVHTGDVICSRPGEIWSWQPDSQLEGLVLIFEETFLLSFFNDSHFLERLAYLHPKRTSPFLRPDVVLYERLYHLLSFMKTEIDENRGKDRHILRAMLYEALMLLNRSKISGKNGLPMSEVSAGRYVESFIRAVNAEYIQRRDVEYYAGKLCITSNYLNKIVRKSLGTTAKFYIHEKVLEEAERLLIYTTLTVKEIAERLHFDNSSYFVRFFKKHTCLTPLQYRENSNSPQK